MWRSPAISFNPFQNASSRLTLVLWLCDNDRALEDQRFHETPPICSRSTAQPFPLWRLQSGPLRRPSIQYSGVVLRSCPPPRIPDRSTSSFLSGSAGTAIFFGPAPKSCCSVTCLPHRPHAKRMAPPTFIGSPCEIKQRSIKDPSNRGGGATVNGHAIRRSAV